MSAAYQTDHRLRNRRAELEARVKRRLASIREMQYELIEIAAEIAAIKEEQKRRSP